MDVWQDLNLDYGVIFIDNDHMPLSSKNHVYARGIIENMDVEKVEYFMIRITLCYIEVD